MTRPAAAARRVPIAVQLYSLREALAADARGTIERVAEMGYDGVEPFGLTPESARVQKALFDEFGLRVCSVHAPLHVAAKADTVLQVADILDCDRVVSGYGPEDFATLEGVARCCDGFNRAQELAARHGLRYGVHNHWWEFEPVEGRLPYRRMLDALDPAVFYQLDVYWVQAAGLDPHDVIAELDTKADMFHLKDGSTHKDDPMTALGTGAVDIAGIVAATRPTAHWWIVELDRCATDMFTAVADSLTYLESLAP